MKNIIAICLTTLIILSQANGNIVDQLTKLNQKMMKNHTFKKKQRQKKL